MSYLLITFILCLLGWWLIFFNWPGQMLIYNLERVKAWTLNHKLNLKIYLIGSLITILVYLLFKVLVLSLISLIFTVALPGIIYQRHRKKILHEKANAWPYLIEDLTSAIKAGMPLSDSLLDVSRNAPEPIKPEMNLFNSIFRKSSQMKASLIALREQVTDPVGVLVVRMLLVVSQSGANDLAKSLRILNDAIREHEQVMREVKARQSWVLNSARLAVIAPWVVLVAIWPQPTVQAAYQSQQGQVILLSIALICFIAYFFMKKMAVR